MAEVSAPEEQILLTHFIVSDDVERSRRFYTEVLGGRVAFSSPGGPTNVALSNSWIVINGGGGPTDDKPEVILETPGDPNRVSSFVNIRVKDIETVYSLWSARGAQFLTPPKQHQYEIRCYIRDPDGHLIEVGQTTDPQGDWVPDRWPSSTPSDDLPTPPEGIVLAHFIVSDDVERSRRFYTDVLGGRHAFSGPGGLTYVQLSNSWIIINVGGGPTDDKPQVALADARRSQPGQQLPQYPGDGHARRVRRMECAGCAVPDATEAARVRDPLLHPRSRWPSDRSGTNDGPGGRLVPRSMALEQVRQ